MWRFLFLLLCVPVLVDASNAGFVRGLWYDTEKFFVGDSVRVYVAIRNNTDADLSGTVEFFVNDKKIERKNVDALNGRIVESWADWQPAYGTSTVTATLSRTKISSTASGTQAVTLTSTVAKDIVFVDYDTDRDGIGNETDTDDDNDTIPDTEEAKGGTDPLDPNDPAPEPEEPTDDESNEKVEDANEGLGSGAAGDGSGASASGRPIQNIAVNNDSNSNEPAGLEQFLVDSRADSVLTGVTNVINTTKKKVDEYRNERELRQKIERGDIDIPVNKDGFGKIVRISPEENSRPVAEKPEGFFGDLITLVGNLLSAIFTGVLFVFSFALGYPVLMQLLLLFLILFIIYKLARRLGRRSQ